MSTESKVPFIVGLGGTVRGNSSTERALRFALEAAETAGARTQLFSGVEINLPIYNPENKEAIPAAERLITALRRADGIIIASPGYHGGISGLVKNALDYVEEMREDGRPYFDGRAVGCISTGAGWQGTVVTLMALRAVTHALRAWPTPVGVAINSAERPAEATGTGFSQHVCGQLVLMAKQIVEFANRRPA